MDEYENIYTAQTAIVQPGEQALVVREEKLQLERQAWDQEYERQVARVRQNGLAVEEDKLASKKEQAENWTEEKALSDAKAAWGHQFELVKRDKEALEKREKEQHAREIQRRRDRTPSLAFIEDSFVQLSPQEVVAKLNNSSVRIKKHAMDNVTFCIDGPRQVPPSYVSFGAPDIAPILLPQLEILLKAPAASLKPVESVREFSEEVVSSPAMAKALALSGQCPCLAGYLVQDNELVSRLASSSLGQMIRSEPAIMKLAFNSLEKAIEHVPAQGSDHHSVTFFEEIAPKMVAHFFDNDLWSSVAPLVAHRVDSIRQVVLPKVLFEAQSSDRVRHGLVEAGTIRLLEQHYSTPEPALDIIEFFTGLLPLLARKMCRHRSQVLWLMDQLAAPNARVNNAVIEALRVSSRKEDPAIHEIFVKIDILNRLDNPPTQVSPRTTKLICELLPILALPHARSRTCGQMIRFLDHKENSIATACLAACQKILKSSVENRAELYSNLEKLTFSKESTLILCESAIPVLCKDWAAKGDFSRISTFLSHPERRVRCASHQVWRSIYSNSPEIRAQVGLGLVLELCASVHEDCVILGSQLLPLTAAAIAKAGAHSTRKLVGLLNHPRSDLRQAVLHSIQIICESGEKNCEILQAAGAFVALKVNLQENPLDGVETARTILIRLAPVISQSHDACYGLLQLLDSNVPQVESAAQAALARISHTNIEFRTTLRSAILACLNVFSELLIEFSAQAIRNWIGPDLVQLNEYDKLLQLVIHNDRQIQIAALHSLKRIIKNENYHDALEKAGAVSMIQSLSNSHNVECIRFAACALSSMARTLARKGHVRYIMQTLTRDVPEIQDAASTAIQKIANGSEQDRIYLLNEDILEGLAARGKDLGETELQIAAAVIPRLARSYLHAGKVHCILALVDHKQEQVRVAAAKSILAIAGGTDAERIILRDALLPLLPAASASLSSVASACLERSLARTLISDGEYEQAFNLLGHEDAQIRQPVISALQHHIHASSEPTRRILVNAGVLKAVLHVCTPGKDDLVSFTVDCVLPVLGPSFAQTGGEKHVMGLLTHDESRIRTAATAAIRNGIESRHGSGQNIADARLISYLYPWIEDDAIQDLWCYALPKLAPYVSHLDEINIIFDSLCASREGLRRAASEAISRMAKTSDETRLRLFPALLPRLHGPPSLSLKPIAQVVALSGFAFVLHNKEAELVDLIQYEETPLAEAAVDAVIHILCKGGPEEHSKLMEAELFTVSLALLAKRSQRKLSLTLLNSIVRHLCPAIVVHQELTEQLLCLFDDPDESLCLTLRESLYRIARDPKLNLSSTLPHSLPLLLQAGRPRKSSVSKFLVDSAPQMARQLFKLTRVDVIVLLLTSQENEIAAAYLAEIQVLIAKAATFEKDLLVDHHSFLPALEVFLKSRDNALRRDSSEIITSLSNGSPPRSSKIMQQGISASLLQVAIKVDTPASLNALWSLFAEAPDYTDQIADESVFLLRDILGDVDRSVDIYRSALWFLKEITERTQKIIIRSGIIGPLVGWISPQHSILDPDCRQSVVHICELIAQNSDTGRQALIDAEILPVLLGMLVDKTTNHVLDACSIVKALAHTGNFRSELSVIQKALERITDRWHKSTLEIKADKSLVQKAAKEALSSLKAKRVVPAATDGSPASRGSKARSGHSSVHRP